MIKKVDNRVIPVKNIPKDEFTVPNIIELLIFQKY